MNVREMALGLFLIAGVASFVMLLLHLRRGGDSLRHRRSSAMLDALGDAQLDPATRAELLRAIAHEHVGFFGRLTDKLQQPVVWRAIWFGIGWFLMILAGAGLVVSRYVTYATHEVPRLLMFTAIGFAMVSMPMAWRELTRRAAEHDAA